MILGKEENFYNEWWSKTVMQESLFLIDAGYLLQASPGQPDDTLVVITQQSRLLEDRKKHAAAVHQVYLAYQETWNKRFFRVFQYENIPFLAIFFSTL